MSSNKKISLITITSILILSGCSSQPLVTGTGRQAPNAYDTYKQQGLKVPDNSATILKPNIRSNYLLQLNDIQQKTINAILVDQSKNLKEQIEPAQIEYLNSKNLNHHTKDPNAIDENSTNEDDILFDDKSLFNENAPKQEESKTENNKLDIHGLTSTVSISKKINTDEIPNKNFINAFKHYILYDENTKKYTNDLLKLHITTNNLNRLQFFRLLDAESQPKQNKYLLYKMGIMVNKATEYVLDVNSENNRIKKLISSNQKITGDLAPMYQIGDNDSTFIGGYLNKVGIHTRTKTELQQSNDTRHHKRIYIYRKK